MTTRSGIAVLLLLVAQGCRGSRESAPGSAQAGSAPAAIGETSTDGAAMPASGQPWDDAIGPLVALASPDGVGATLFMRDTTRVAAVDVEWFTHDEHTTRATVLPGAVLGCAWVRAATVSGPTTGAAVIWAVALAPGAAKPLPLDAIVDLSPRDSSALAIRVSRLASALTEDSVSAPFQGLPVVVRDAWRTRLPDGTPVVIAVAVRSLGTESNPRAEIVTLVAEPENASQTAAWRTAYFRRDAGPEDRVEGADLLASLLLHGKTPTIALVRETDHGPAVDFVERTAPGAWQLRWTTASLSCTH